jgi:hypothetical protein
MAAFLQLRAQNLPVHDSLQIWCSFTVFDNNTYVGTYEILSEAIVLEQNVSLGGGTRIQESWLACEIPKTVVDAPTSRSFQEQGRDVVEGRLVCGSEGKVGRQNPERPSGLDFVVHLSTAWSITRMELRDSRIYAIGHHLPAVEDNSNLVCIIEASGYRISQAVVLNSTELYCQMQSYNGSATIRVRDLQTGENSSN